MDRYRITPGSDVDLTQWDANDKGDFPGGKAEGKAMLGGLNSKMASLQRRLYAQGKHKVLVVLQAMDTGGKDGTIRHVFRGTNPQGVTVASFKVPTPEELGHDYLWRIHARTPGTGQITIFNRSHYEDVLVVRVHDLVPQEVWAKRYDQINDFEERLAAEGTTLVKIYLHISKEEQKARLQARLDDPEKAWKFSLGDLKERKLWDDYMAAYQDALAKTSTEWAPWYVVPANRKWYRNLVVSNLLIDTIEGLGVEFPEVEDDLAGVVIED